MGPRVALKEVLPATWSATNSIVATLGRPAIRTSIIVWPYRRRASGATSPSARFPNASSSMARIWGPAASGVVVRVSNIVAGGPIRSAVSSASAWAGVRGVGGKRSSISTARSEEGTSSSSRSSRSMGGRIDSRIPQESPA